MGQSASTLMGARSSGLAYASSTLSDDWSLFNNVGGIAKIKKLSTVFAYEASPSLPGANRMAAIINLPLRFGSVSSGFFRFGDAIYNEQVISAGFGNQLGNTSLGFKANYIQYYAEGFGIQSAWSIGLGGITQITNQLLVGAYVSNINQPRIGGQDDERIPVTLAAGMGFTPNDRVRVIAELMKDMDYAFVIKGAFEYVLYKKIALRTGFNLQPSAGFLGVGYLGRRLTIDYSIQYSYTSGLIHQVSACYFITQRRKENG